MPDGNKLEALEGAGFRIVGVCGTCVWSTIGAGGGWGTCLKIPYEHEKHTAKKFASVHFSGTCPQFTMDPAHASGLESSGFGRFMSK